MNLLVTDWEELAFTVREVSEYSETVDSHGSWVQNRERGMKSDSLH